MYQAFALLETHISHPEQISFAIDYVTSIEDKLTVELKRDVLQRAQTESPKTGADGILATLYAVYQETIDNTKVVDEKEELNEADLLGVVDETANGREPVSRSTQSASAMEVPKKEMRK